jgi:uncharacterized membrane protein (UPF0127 family)
MKKAIIVGIVVLGAWFAASSMAQKHPQVCFGASCVDVDVVSEQKDLELGLSGRADMPKDYGMLFVFASEGRYRFWMKEMKFNLDILWINQAGEIVYIAPNLSPCIPENCPLYTPPQNARYVLEVNSGYAASHHVNVGDHASVPTK